MGLWKNAVSRICRRFLKKHKLAYVAGNVAALFNHLSKEKIIFHFTELNYKYAEKFWSSWNEIARLAGNEGVNFAAAGYLVTGSRDRPDLFVKREEFWFKHHNDLAALTANEIFTLGFYLSLFFLSAAMINSFSKTV